jgi:tetratricopeptide (TPR) repeat protein
MDESTESAESMYSVHNESSIQGQVIGDNATVHQHFYATGGDPQPSSTLDQAWNVPYRRNPFFTGRETLLQQVHEHFLQKATAALTQSQAITGLGGIGKTQTAVEYAYRYKDDYRFVLWANATNQVTLTEGFVKIARVLQLPEREEPDLSIVVEAVKHWLTTSDRWLLILDNADDFALITDFLPSGDKGHLLFTTREAATGHIAHGFEVDKMTEAEGSLFLLRRANILSNRDIPITQVSESDRKLAAAIVAELDGLPLALEQAGAYIEETQSTLAAYLQAYQRRQVALLQRQGRTSPAYPYSVATTWSLNFGQVEQRDPRAADLLRFLAFLAPDVIPEDLLVKGAYELGPQMQAVATDETLLDEAIGTLRHFSLVQRNTDTHLVFIHRLVQIVLKTAMIEDLQRQWAERTVKAVNRAFPDPKHENWTLCQQYLPHAQQCAALITHYGFAFREAILLLNESGLYLHARGQYEQAEPFLEQALEIGKQVVGARHPDTATGLNNLARLSHERGQYAKAESLMKEALAIDEEILGPLHPTTALDLNNLAGLYYEQGEYEKAEPLYKRALEIRERMLGPEHSDTAQTLNNLALLYHARREYKEAEFFYQKSLKIRQRVLGPQHPETASCQNNLGTLYHDMKQYEKAEPLLRDALTICEQTLGPEHPTTGQALNNLGEVYRAQGHYEKAEPLLKRALAIREKIFNTGHPTIGTNLNNLALLYLRQGKYDLAEPLLKRAISIYEQFFGPDHPKNIPLLENYAALLQQMKRVDEAAKLEARIKAMQARSS